MKFDAWQRYEDAHGNTALNAFFSEDSKMVGVLMKTGYYNIYRTIDGSLVCALEGTISGLLSLRLKEALM